MKLRLFLSLVIFLTSSLPAAESADFIKFKTERVIVFKDGYALVIKKGRATTDASGEIQTLQVPDAAVLGSFWSTTDQGELIGMRAGWVEEQETNRVAELCKSNFQILEANKGRQCEALMSDNRRVKGVIRETIGSDRLVTVPDSALRRLTVRTGGTGSRRQREGSLVVLSGDDGDQLISVANIKSVSIKEMELRTKSEITVKHREKRLTFRFAMPNAEREITLMYFRPGIRWIPAYRINLPAAGEKVAKVHMQAELLNEAEDLIDTPVDIVVGVPNFRFKDTPSPFVLEGVMRNALRQALPVVSQQLASNFSNSAYAQRTGEFRGNGAHRPSAPVQLPGELTAARSQDLFIYSLPEMRLRKGDRVAMNIVEIDAPYRDVYTWDLRITRHDIATAPSSKGASPLKLSENRIWRQIDLTNTSNVPWTTGAAMIMQGRQPLAQELLTYTSIGNRCRIPVTVSIDTRGSVDEKETGRQLSALTWDRYKYALIKNEAVIEISNNKPKAIDVELTVRLGGRVTDASEEGDVTLMPYSQNDWVQYRGSTAVNNSSRVLWKKTIEPGECFSPKIANEFYTRH